MTERSNKTQKSGTRVELVGNFMLIQNFQMIMKIDLSLYLGEGKVVLVGI